MSNQQIQGERLGEQVSWLLLGVDPMKTKGGVVPAGVLHEVKIFVVDVLGPGSHLGNLRNRQRTIVVFKSPAMNNRAFRRDVEAHDLHLI